MVAYWGFFVVNDGAPMNNYNPYMIYCFVYDLIQLNLLNA